MAPFAGKPAPTGFVSFTLMRRADSYRGSGCPQNLRSPRGLWERACPRFLKGDTIYLPVIR